MLDFMDLLLVARDLVRDRAAMRAELQHRISHIFVDEFQDTDPLQAEILLLLAADDPAESDWHRARPLPGKLFIVGDPKQSIYRFRRADVALYQEVKRRLLECGAELEHLDGQLSCDSRTASGRQRRICAADAVGVADSARVLAADAVSRGLRHAAVAGRAARAGAFRRSRLRHQAPDRANRPPTRRARWCDGWSRRADGP